MELIINMVLDESGSMGSVKDSTISAMNEYLESLKEKKTKGSMSLTLFATEVKNPYTGIPLKDVPKLTPETYQPDGMTALYDAVCKTISDTEKKAGEKRPVLFIIMTDGQENSSREYTHKDMQSMISRLEGKKNWTFVFLGANQDSYAVAQQYGLKNMQNVVNYSNTSQGIKVAMRSTADATSFYAAGLSPQSMSSDSFFNDDQKSQIENQ